MIGEVIDHYRVLELVGRGAMGVVYQALDVNLDRQVAIKVMSAEARDDPDFVERFRLEARAQGALNHPNVALLFDYFVHEGTPVAVMEFIDGESLEQLIKRRGAIPAHEAVPIFKQALRGVAAAHRAGIVHRDLKPGNLMVTRDGTVKVMDFGIAKRAGVTGATKVSTSIGSPLYMAPEQILGRAVDCRTDIYALGITLYELLSGQRPFNSRGKAEYLVLDAHVNDLPEPPTVYRYGIPQPIVDAVMRSLAKDPDVRFQSADEFIAALPDIPAPAVAAPAAGVSATVVLPRKESTGTLVLPPRESTGTAALPRQGPTGTVAMPRAGPTGTMALPRAASSATVALEYSPPSDRSRTTVSEHPPTKRIDPPGSMEFDYSAGTVWQQLHADDSPPVARNAPSAGMPPAPRRAYPLGIAAVLIATLVLGALLVQPHRPRAMLPARSPAASGPSLTPAQAPTAMLAPPPPIASSQVEATAATALPVEAGAAADPPTAAPPAPTSTPARRDLAGTWRGAYVDASGKQLLRVVSLSISRVHDDGGIEGTLQYEAASGEGECRLYPHGSTYSVGAGRLRLSPQSCSPHYPRELGVPLDFDRVNPRANTLKNGRIEAPTGEVIRVRLQRMSGA
ncbi:MAG TPA: protein kinase [Steroidobacteraceae bacterium]|nr:protein kinase [Steroidobacteraceae bacterium]